MQSIPWLTILVVWPLAGALLIGLVPPIRLHGRALAMIWSLIELVVTVLTVIAWTQGSGPVRLEILASWISQLGISYALGLTALGLLMIVLGAALVPLVLAAAWRDDKTPQRGGSHAAWLLALEASLMAVFTARDIVLFYVVFEAMLIPVYFLIGSFGGLQRRRASLKFLIYSLAGGLVMLAGVIAYGVYAGGDAQAFYLDGLTEPVLSQSAERLIFLSFFVAFAVKAPLWPVHTWLPDAAQAARPGTSALLVGVLDKVGTFGMITLCLPLFPNAVRWAAPVIIVLAVVSVVWGAVLALVQKDILRLIAYTSISHFGFIVLGIFVFDWQALSGASFYMLAHGLATAGLFLLS
ncbi:MAG: NADH-quinone oxidoreductase subunit M, partial [Bifidobacteriaceae bacterium]|nr:NADH-quinone oxidoreductase subunit M [Bifidobacteriaceae bacterium]